MKVFAMLVRLLKRLRLILAIFIIVFAILISLFRAMTPFAVRYKPGIEDHLSALIGQKVTVKNLETSLYWFQPVLRLENITIFQSQKTVLTINKALIGINLWSSFWHGQIEPGILLIDSAHIFIEKNQQAWQIRGLNFTQSKTNLPSASFLPVLQRALAQKKIIMKHIAVSLSLENGKRIELDQIDFTANHFFGHYRLKLSGRMQEKTHGYLMLIADLSINPLALDQISGSIYLHLKQFNLKYLDWLPVKQDLLPKKGLTSLELWIDLTQGQMTEIQSKLNLESAEITAPFLSKPLLLNQFSSNFLWKSTPSGWRLQADKLKITAAQQVWPETKFLLESRAVDEHYYLYLQSLNLEKLYLLGFSWPEKYSNFKKHPLKGELNDVQISIDRGDLNYFLARFKNLSWKEFDEIPGVKKLAGSIHWEPEQGHLEIDAPKSKLTFKSQAPIEWQEFIFDLQWNHVSGLWRFALNQLSMVHPDLILSAEGFFDGSDPFQINQMKMSADFFAKSVQNWIKYAPGRYLKPGFNTWLKSNILKLNKASGHLTLNGPFPDFPFDNPASGEFRIDGTFSGLSVKISDRWPINEDIDGSWYFLNRSFRSNLNHAQLKKITVESAKVSIDEIGTGKESVLIQLSLKNSADKIKDYLFNSPLQKLFKKLKSIQIANLLNLDLDLNLPLYPEGKFLMNGKLGFDKNQVRFVENQAVPGLDALTGPLFFSELGLKNSELKAFLGADPLQIHVEAIGDLDHRTKIYFDGSSSVDALQKLFKMPPVKWVNGHFAYKGLLNLGIDESSTDYYHLESTSEGLSLSLPEPFSKTAQAAAPLSLDLSFSVKDGTLLSFNYADLVKGALPLPPVPLNNLPKSGQIVFGPGKAHFPTLPGWVISGSLNVFDVDAWRQAMMGAQNASSSGSDFLGMLRELSLKFNSLILWGKVYEQSSFQIVKKNADEWSLAIKQPDIDANLGYIPAKNLWTGEIKYLKLNNNPSESQEKFSFDSPFTPQSIPNLDITVNQLNLGDAVLGKLALKGNQQGDHWHLDFCNLQSDDYHLSFEGDWSRSAKSQVLSLQMDLKIYDLAQALERWSIAPAVEAKRGSLHFSGDWRSSLDHFSLKGIDGNLKLSLRDGRITHLNTETEKKIGLGKLLSIVSLQTIPRRLKLDFRDLSQQGYSFDVYTGNFRLKDGVLSTADSYINGPVAYASITGDLDLVRHLYDLDLHVTPYITASLPLVATLAGGPIAGVATWVASNLISKGMQQISGYAYKVSGPWMDPVVQQLKIYQKP